MTQSATGSTEAAASACPFVALEHDRDARAQAPDERHRCFAEDVPAPRSLAHQERFCLSADFAACPIFAEWAVRAAARPVPGVAGVADPAPELWVERIDKSVPEQREEHWPDSMDTAPSAAGLAAAAAPDADAQQLAAFQAPDDSPRSSAGFAAPAVPEAVTDEPPLGASSMLAPPAPADDNRDFDPAPLPTFLATRSPRERTSFRERVAEESLTPVGEANVQGSGSGRRDGDRDGAFTRLLTMAAIVIILALGIATVIIVPGLLAGDPGQTGRPSLVAGASRQPTSLATSVAVGPTAPPDGASAFPTSEIPTPEATPTPTPRTYRVKAGDRLRQIAREFGVTVDQILAANPEIGDPNDIREGQRILIPTP